MNISFPINKLLNRGLTADDYTIGMLLKEEKYGLLKNYIDIKGGSFFKLSNRFCVIKTLSKNC